MVAKYRKNKRAELKNLIFPVLFGAMILLLIGFLVNANLKLSERKKEFRTEAAILGKELKELRSEKDLLEKQVSQSVHEDYLEKIARETRNLMKEGEKAVVIIPPSEEDQEEEQKDKSFLESILNWIK